MATKKAPATTTPRIPRAKLRPTDLEGVFTAPDGRRVDEHGVDLDFKTLKRRDEQRFTEALGKSVETPAELLKAVALDPRNNLSVRVDAANKAAPYFTPKLVAVQGVAGAAPIGIQEVSSLPQKDLDRLEALYAQAAELLNKAGS